MNKSLKKRIELANKYILFAQRNFIWGLGYFGSTWPVHIEYTEPITVSPKGNVVLVEYMDHMAGSSKAWSGGKLAVVKQRFDVRNEERRGDLRHEISNYIIRAIKNGAKEDGIKVPAFK
jgi:hypothetical protein